MLASLMRVEREQLLQGRPIQTSGVFSQKLAGARDVSETEILPLSDEFLLLSEETGAFESEDFEDEEESERLILEGQRALHKKIYWEAQEKFALAVVDFDSPIQTSARFWYGLSCLWMGELVEAGIAFGEIADESDIARAGVVARILTQWCDLCHCSSREEYWRDLRDLYGSESEEDLFEVLSLSEEDVVRGGAEGVLQAGLLSVVKEDYQSCLRLFAQVDVNGHRCSPWIRDFWLAMSQAVHGEEEQATSLVYSALASGMPPVLLGPLRWLKTTHPDPSSWYHRIVRPLFVFYDSLYNEHPDPIPRDGFLTLPSQASRIAPIRRGLPVNVQETEAKEVVNELEISLSNVRGPVGPAQVLLVEFDSGTDEGHRHCLWPTRFVVHSACEEEGIAHYAQEFWIDYTAGRLAVKLIDRGFHLKTDAAVSPLVGRDFRVGEDSYPGRGGIFWMAQTSDFQITTLGTTKRLSELPPDTSSYLQELVHEALPFVEIFCSTCDRQKAQVNGVWCSHIFFCSHCQRISSPVERSRRIMGRGPLRCTHRFPKNCKYSGNVLVRGTE